MSVSCSIELKNYHIVHRFTKSLSVAAPAIPGFGQRDSYINGIQRNLDWQLSFYFHSPGRIVINYFTVSNICNPTDGSPRIIQILSTASAVNQLGIPRTVVRGSFRSFLPQAPPTSWESHGRQSVEDSDPYLLQALPTSWESHGRQSVDFSDPFYRKRY